MPYLSLVSVYLGIVNLLTVQLFRLDKSRAISGGWRIREDNLLLIALIGGTPGAFAARHLLRHKTRKEPFSTQLSVIIALQVGLAVGLVVAFWR